MPTARRRLADVAWLDQKMQLGFLRRKVARQPERDRSVPCGRSPGGATAARAIETDQCGIDRETAARAPCESDSRLTPISTGVYSADCGERRLKLTSELQQTPDSLGFQTPTFCKLLRPLAGFF